MQNKIFKGDDIIGSALERLMPKDDNYFSLKDATLCVPGHHFESVSACNKSNKDINPSVTSSKKSVPRTVQSQQGFFTDLSVLKTGDQQEKSKRVLTRLKMMI